MTSDRNIDIDVDNLRSDAMNDYWYNVIMTYKHRRELRMARITKGDTVLHMAVSSGKEYEVNDMVDTVCRHRISEQDNKWMPLPPVDENGDEKKLVLGAQNDQGNTPLHLAASIGNVRMCKKIGGIDSSLIIERNHAGETPLFLAAFHGHREAFLWLHYKYTGSPGGVSSTDIAHCIKRDNDDTILHCALEKEHIDVAMEIVFLYKGDHLKEMTLMRNKNGLSPLHILAVTSSIFKSTDLTSRSYIIQLLYHWFFRVKKKERATTSDEQERKSCISNWIAHIGDRISTSLDYLFMILLFPLVALEVFYIVAAAMLGGEPSRDLKIRRLIYYSRYYLQRILLFPLYALKYLFKAAEAGSEIVDTPLMTAAKNGLIEMVEKILKRFPSTMTVVNEEGKNIVLLAAEKRQTKLYQIMCENEYCDKSLFRHVDKNGNTALHLAAKPSIDLDLEATTMIQECKWFEFVRCSVPSELREKYNKDGKTAKEIFRRSYKKLMTSDRQWLYQTSQTCSVASTVIASMAFSHIMSDKFDEKNYSTLAALSLALTSTISFLAILAFRSQSLTLWRCAHFMLQIAISTMFGSIVTLWFTLVLNAKSSPATYAILGMPIAILTIVSLPIFIGPTLTYLFAKVPAPNRNTTCAIHNRRTQKEEIAADSNLRKRKMQQIRIP